MEKDNVLKIQAVVDKIQRSRSSIYNDVKAGRFPKPIKIGERSSGWLASEVEAWIKKLAEKRGA